MKRGKTMLKRIAGMLVMVFLAMTQMSCATIESMLNRHQDDHTIYLASIAPPDYLQNLGFQEAMDLALDEVNSRGLINGKYKLQIEVLDDKDDLTTGMRVAQQVVKEARYTAVIGHWTANVALPTAKIYENGGRLVLSPAVSNVKLTQDASNYIFRTVPSDQDEINKIMEYIQEKGYDRLAVCYADTKYGQGLVELLGQACKERDITITDIHRTFVNQDEFEKQYRKWAALDTKAVFVADALPSGIQIVKQVRSQSPDLPILSAGGFGFDDVNALMEGQASNISYVDPYYHDRSQAKIQRFNALYKAKYSKEPGQLSIEGYDIVHRLADAIEKAGSTDTAAISRALKSTEDWEGTTDSFHFDEKGNVIGRRLTIVEVRKGQYHYSN
ncbi:MAG: ABC transporter substrate-binding protein [Firmicutes bacterium]|nr:ABC transporter substrate-binding protein [Bacillota bacterium]